MPEKKEERDLAEIVYECSHKNMAGPRLKPGVLEFWCTDCGHMVQCAALSGDRSAIGEKPDRTEQDHDNQ